MMRALSALMIQPSLWTIVRLAAALRCKVADLVDVFNKHDLSTLIPSRKERAPLQSHAWTLLVHTLGEHAQL
jgi:hypothetical protein